MKLISEFDEMSQSSDDDVDEDSGKETKDDEGLNCLLSAFSFQSHTFLIVAK